MQEETSLLSSTKGRIPTKGIVIGLVSMIGISVVLWGALLAYARAYEGRVIPGVSIGETPIGGMDAPELKQFLQQMNDKLFNEGLHISIDTEKGKQEFILYPGIVSDTDPVELLHIDIDQEVTRLLAYGKQGNIFTRALVIARSRIGGTDVRLVSITADSPGINERVAEYLEPFENPARNAGIVISSVDPLVYEVVTSSIGSTYDYTTVVDQFIDAWARLRAPFVQLSREQAIPEVSDAALRAIEDRLPRVVSEGDVTLRYENPNTSRPNTWTITQNDIAHLLNVQQQNDAFVFGLSYPSTTVFLQNVVGDDIYVEPQDAKFSISDGRVVEFQGSQTGLALDVDATYTALNDRIIERNNTPVTEGNTSSIDVVVAQTEAAVRTGEVNDLGISQLLGEGVSSYAGSPANRMKNIKNALKKLNGVLIKPGEEFSTIEHTKPYTLEGGYLPELVIKGNEIKPEIGGGLCQIGSTLFRMAMNSGMPITERRNHSLVVNYYNDLSNGLPGTDATIYDPAPDFRFKNDTGSYILLQTAIDEEKQLLVFSLWGTPDGRSGSYSAPVVHRWIPHGPTQIINTTKLAPGVRECQHAYRGADASFVYTRRLPDGTSEETVFESHYRPLQQICLVGVDPSAMPCEDSAQCPNTSSEEGSSSDETLPLLPTESAPVIEETPFSPPAEIPVFAE